MNIIEGSYRGKDVYKEWLNEEKEKFSYTQRLGGLLAFPPKSSMPDYRVLV